jgi:hypothetical protein
MRRGLVLALVALMVVGRAGFAQLPPLHAQEAIQGRFMQERHLAGLAAPLRTEGRFLLVAGKGLIWRGEKPFATVVVITPAGIVQIIDGREVQRLAAARLPFLARFYDMLSGALAGDWSAMDRDFAINRQGDGKNWKIVLRPLHADDPAAAQLQSITVRGAAFVEKAEIHRAGGDWEQVEFLDQARSSAPLAPEDARLFESAAQ